MKTVLQKIMGRTRIALERYDMIRENDTIAVGLSGGKDSMTLLYVLAEMRKYYPVPFDVVGIHVNMGFERCRAANRQPFSAEPMQRLCESLRVKYVEEDTEIAVIVFDERQEEHPCSLCANMRRGALVNAALRNGCGKLALGHHYNDVAETLVMNLFLEGNFGCFSPVKTFPDKGIALIRPLIYTEEKDIRSFVRKAGIEIVPSPCPADKNTEREWMKQYLRAFEKEHQRGLYRRLVGALERSGTDGWKEK